MFTNSCKLLLEAIFIAIIFNNALIYGTICCQNQSVIQCPSSNDHCSINCAEGTNTSYICNQKQNRCCNSMIMCPVGYDCNINCNSSFSCQDLIVHAENSTSLHITNCSKTSCNNITVYCPLNSLVCMMNNNVITNINITNINDKNKENNHQTSLTWFHEKPIMSLTLIVIMATFLTCCCLCICCIAPYFYYRMKQLKELEKIKLHSVDQSVHSQYFTDKIDASPTISVCASAVETNISQEHLPSPVLVSTKIESQTNIIEAITEDLTIERCTINYHNECNGNSLVSECNIVKKMINIMRKFEELTLQKNCMLTSDDIVNLILKSIYTNEAYKINDLSAYNIYYLFVKNDYNHILESHDDTDSFFYMYSNIWDYRHFVCDVDNCGHLIRSMNHEYSEKQDLLILSLFDQLHSYFVHSYDMGMRLKPLTYTPETPNTYKSTTKYMTNYSMSNIAYIGDTRNYGHTSNYNGSQINNNESFQINNSESLQTHVALSNEETENEYTETYVNRVSINESDESDESQLSENLTAYLSFSNVLSDKPRNIQQLITAERQGRFVSEVVDNAYTSKFLDGSTTDTMPHIIDELPHIIDEKISTYEDNNIENDDGVYQIGIRWLYWPKYKLNKYYVKPKFDTFKQELLNKQHFKLLDWNAVYEKSVMHLNSYKGRNLTCNESPLINDYDLQLIKNESKMSLQCMISLVMYCNFDKLQYFMKQSFRKLKENETLLSIKKRNEYYAHWSKLLRESIEIYGTLMRDTRDIKFYHGISGELVFHSTICQFCPPTSFTTSLSIATSFGGGSGIIVQLEMYGLDVAYFDCRWISHYSSEMERVVCGGFQNFIIKSIMLIRLRHNYKQYLKAINIILSLINCKFNPEKIRKKTIKIIKAMITYFVVTPKKNPFDIPPYILKLFDCIRINWNKEIKISLPQLRDYEFYQPLKEIFVDEDEKWINFNIINKLFVSCPKITICGSYGNDGILLSNKTFQELLLFLSPLSLTNKLNQIIFESPNQSLLNGKTAQINYTQQFEKLNFRFNYEQANNEGISSIFITKAEIINETIR